MIGYQYGSLDGFPPDLGGGYLYNPNIDNIYVDGVYDSNPRKHVWTLGVGVFAHVADEYCCPCNTDSTGTIQYQVSLAMITIVSQEKLVICGDISYMLMTHYGMDNNVEG